MVAVTDAYEVLSDLADHSASLEACLFALHATMARAISPVGLIGLVVRSVGRPAEWRGLLKRVEFADLAGLADMVEIVGSLNRWFIINFLVGSLFV